MKNPAGSEAGGVFHFSAMHFEKLLLSEFFTQQSAIL